MYVVSTKKNSVHWPCGRYAWLHCSTDGVLWYKQDWKRLDCFISSRSQIWYFTVNHSKYHKSFEWDSLEEFLFSALQSKYWFKVCREFSGKWCSKYLKTLSLSFFLTCFHYFLLAFSLSHSLFLSLCLSLFLPFLLSFFLSFSKL